MAEPITDEQIEAILLLYYLTDLSVVNAAYAVVPDFDRANFAQTAELTIRLKAKQKHLELITKEAHSRPISDI